MSYGITRSIEQTLRIHINGKPLPEGAEVKCIQDLMTKTNVIWIELPKEEHETIIKPIVTLSDAVRHWAQGDA